MTDDDDEIRGETEDEEIVRQAKNDFRRAEEWEANARTHFIEDTKFSHGDAYNLYQWPQTIQDSRNLDRAPMLTINKTNVHCLQIINDSRQNKQGIAVHAVGENASGDAANILEGIIRHIEYRSNAQQAYDAATDHMVRGGWGWVRVNVGFEDERSFNQDISICRMADPLSVYGDPDIKEYDGSDAKFGFVFEDVLRSEAKSKYPKYVDDFGTAIDGNDAWNTKDHVRVAEYFKKSDEPDKLIQLRDGTTLLKSEIPKEAREAIKPFILQERDTTSPVVKWYKIIGDKIVERKDWPGKYIPLARMVGTETVIDGVMDRRGHVRALLDAQKMYNYQSSGAVAFVSLQTKTPWVAPVRAIEGYEAIWQSANLKNHGVLPWNDVDDDGKPIARPERVAPPAASAGNIEGLKIAQEEMMLASGQYQAVMGAPSNETSGKAINARQRQGDNATYHFIDHASGCIRYVGRIVLDLIPRVYDTPRVLQVLGRDESLMKVQLNPQAQSAIEKKQDWSDESSDFDPEKIAAVLNPNVGKYDVISDVGPSYATQRQEAFNALGQIMAQSKEMAPIVGDIWAKNADFPGSDVVADRFHNMIPQQALGGPSPEVVQMHQQMSQLAQQGQQQIEQLHAELQAAKQKIADQSIDLERKEFEAATARMKAAGDIDPEAMKPLIREMISQALGVPIVPIMAQHAAAEQAMQPPEPDPNAQAAGGPMDGS